MMNRFLLNRRFWKKMIIQNLSTQIQHLINIKLKQLLMITLKETTERYNLGRNKRFKMLIRAISLLLLVIYLCL